MTTISAGVNQPVYAQAPSTEAPKDAELSSKNDVLNQETTEELTAEPDTSEVASGEIDYSPININTILGEAEDIFDESILPETPTIGLSINPATVQWAELLGRPTLHGELLPGSTHLTASNEELTENSAVTRYYPGIHPNSSAQTDIYPRFTYTDFTEDGTPRKFIFTRDIYFENDSTEGVIFTDEDGNSFPESADGRAGLYYFHAEYPNSENASITFPQRLVVQDTRTPEQATIYEDRNDSGSYYDYRQVIELASGEIIQDFIDTDENGLDDRNE